MELPASFIDSARALLGDAGYRELAAALQSGQPVSIRLNPSKPFASRPEERAVPWCASGFYLEERPAFTFDPLFHAGCYYVQEASSMFVEQALRQYGGDAPVAMLDLCAAPGGKSTHFRSLLPEGSLLVANEVVRNRSQILAENLTKWGHPDVVVASSDPSEFAPLEAFFDLILTDVPCSGEGMFRKDPVAVSEWSPENVEICWQRQRRIISDIWPCLKPGGVLVYSTCTYNTKENEENIRWIRDEFGAEVLPLDVPEAWNVTGNLLPGEHFPVYRFLPSRTKGEGFFLAVLRKPAAVSQSPGASLRESESTLPQSAVSVRNGRDYRLKLRGNASETPGIFVENSREKGRKLPGKGKQTPGLSKEELAALRQWVVSPDDYEFLRKEERVSLFPKRWLAVLPALRQALRVVQAGVEVAALKGREWTPAHALAVSRVLAPDAFPCEELSYEQAVAYLRKEAVTLSGAAPRGVVLLTYRHIPLGFAKNIGNRANNLYPQEWRIRSGYLPEGVVSI